MGFLGDTLCFLPPDPGGLLVVSCACCSHTHTLMDAAVVRQHGRCFSVPAYDSFKCDL